jgi:hypothetical protein
LLGRLLLKASCCAQQGAFDSRTCKRPAARVSSRLRHGCLTSIAGPVCCATVASTEFPTNQPTKACADNHIQAGAGRAPHLQPCCRYPYSPPTPPCQPSCTQPCLSVFNFILQTSCACAATRHHPLASAHVTPLTHRPARCTSNSPPFPSTHSHRQAPARQCPLLGHLDDSYNTPSHPPHSTHAGRV